MKYKAFIEEYFIIDDPKTGELVPFIFNKVQNAYYENLKAAGLEELGLTAALREIILKARREGFTSLVLALFAADMILNPEPTIALEINYKSDATKQHFKRFKRFIVSYFKKKGVIKTSDVFDTDNRHELILKDNQASFYVGTASGRIGERGGTVHKLLFSEAAHYPDSEVMSADEILSATMRQVDINSGWVFIESTANGKGNPYHKTWEAAEKGESRFKARFFAAQDFYSEEEIKLIESEFTNKKLYKQEYPRTPEEAFISYEGQFFPEFDPELHVCTPKAILPHYRKFISIDYGYTAPSAVYWLYKDESGAIYPYRELYKEGLTYKALTEEIIANTPINETMDVWIADPSIWAKKGENENELSGAEIMSQRYFEITGKSLMLIKANNDRTAGWNAFREYLKPVMVGDRKTAKLQIYPQCVNLIRTLPLQIYSTSNVEDMNSTREDHAPDSIRYAIMANTDSSEPIQTSVDILLRGDRQRKKGSESFD